MARAASIAAVLMTLVGLSQSAAHEKGLDARLGAIANAVIHGSLAGARADADWIAKRPGISARIAQPAAAVQSASDVGGAAAAVASLAAACGSCHQDAGAVLAIPEAPPAAPGHIVAHMQAHQDAARLLLAGLVAPGSDAWARGARQLSAAPLRSGEFPTSTRIGALMAEIERRLHAQAATAVAADPRARVEHYGAIAATCGQCHARHPSLWERD